jgi:hypothetical protein
MGTEARTSPADWPMTSDNGLPFPSPTPVAQARDKAVEAFREAVAQIAAKSIGDALALACQLPECRNLSIGDAVPLFIEAFRQELNKSGV